MDGLERPMDGYFFDGVRTGGTRPDGTPEFDREYMMADHAEVYGAVFTDGVFVMRDKGALKVSPQAGGVGVEVAPGRACAKGFFASLKETAAFPAGEMANGKYRIIVRLDVSVPVRAFKLIAAKGEGGAFPELVRHGHIYDLCLANVSMEGGVPEITDTRKFPAMCGEVRVEGSEPSARPGLPPGCYGGVALTVRYPDGSPAPRVQVTAEENEGVITGEGGTVNLAFQTGGAKTIEYDDSFIGYGPASVGVELVEGDWAEAELTLEIAPPGTVWEFLASKMVKIRPLFGNLLDIWLLGGGGGGGGGACKSGSTSQASGGDGGGSGYALNVYGVDPAPFIGDEVPLEVGAGGDGGEPSAQNNGNGSAGCPGGATSFLGHAAEGGGPGGGGVRTNTDGSALYYPGQGGANGGKRAMNRKGTLSPAQPGEDAAAGANGQHGTSNKRPFEEGDGYYGAGGGGASGTAAWGTSGQGPLSPAKPGGAAAGGDGGDGANYDGIGDNGGDAAPGSGSGGGGGKGRYYTTAYPFGKGGKGGSGRARIRIS